MARHSSAAPEARALEAALRRLFRSLETRAVPQSMKALLDQLDDRALEGEAR